MEHQLKIEIKRKIKDKHRRECKSAPLRPRTWCLKQLLPQLAFLPSAIMLKLLSINIAFNISTASGKCLVEQKFTVSFYNVRLPSPEQLRPADAVSQTYVCKDVIYILRILESPVYKSQSLGFES